MTHLRYWIVKIAREDVKHGIVKAFTRKEVELNILKGKYWFTMKNGAKVTLGLDNVKVVVKVSAGYAKEMLSNFSNNYAKLEET